MQSCKEDGTGGAMVTRKIFKSQSLGVAYKACVRSVFHSSRTAARAFRIIDRCFLLLFFMFYFFFINVKHET